MKKWTLLIGSMYVIALVITMFFDVSNSTVSIITGIAIAVQTSGLIFFNKKDSKVQSFIKSYKKQLSIIVFGIMVSLCVLAAIRYGADNQNYILIPLSVILLLGAWILVLEYKHNKNTNVK